MGVGDAPVPCGDCPAGRVCGDTGRCFEPALYCNVACPPLAGYSVHCNPQNHCRYWPQGAAEAGTASLGEGASASYQVVIWVPPWDFPMGTDAPAIVEHHGGVVGPQRTVSFSRGFFIDRFPVTAVRFAAFLSARGTNDCDGEACVSRNGEPTVAWYPSGVTGQAYPAETCQSERIECPEEPDRTDSCSTHPATGVSWHGARAFCTWTGKRLCTEAEWERAAKGVIDRLYPWTDEHVGGELPDYLIFEEMITDLGTAMRSYFVDMTECRYPETDEFSNFNGCYHCDSEGSDYFLETGPVKAFPAGVSPVGCWDLLGNAEEWVADDWHASYVGAPSDGSVPWIEEPRASERVTRGGSWMDAQERQDTMFRRARDATDYRLDRVGFRCCRWSD